MKKSILLILALVMTAANNLVFAQNINIPDANFKSALIAAGVDKNGDGEIQESEALEVNYLNLWYKRITDLTGVEYFKNLEELSCRYNLISRIDFKDSLSKLKILDLVFNQISYIDLSNMKNLEHLSTRDNSQITSLDLSKVVKLKSLDIESNDISQLDLNQVTELEYLRAPDNELTSIDLSKTPNLTYLHLDGNPITSLDLSHNSKITHLQCGYTELKSIDVSNLNLNEFWCDNNLELEVVYFKNGVYDNPDNHATIFIGNPKLKYVCTDENEIDRLEQMAISYGLPNVLINSLCAVSSGGSFTTLVGNVKLDLDKDGCSESDGTYPHLKIKISNAVDSGFAITGADGNFSIHLDAGTYTFEPVLENQNYLTANPINAVFTLPDTVGPAFCITPKGNFNDLAVSIIPVRAARPGFSDAQYKIVYKNQGTTTQSGTVAFSFDNDKSNVISSSPIADVSNHGQLSFDFTNLAPFESKSILVTMRTNAPTDHPAVHVNDVLDFSATITGQTDETPEDNTAILYQKVVGSYDPNDKTCLEGDIITPDMVGKRVNYLIRFENTGTAPAENIVVTDYIDTTVFDVNSLLVTDASHTCHTQISKGNKVQFIFSDIQLPFTAPDKHGYVAFSIQLKDDLQIGDSIKNYADIYFDYNLPITTNEAVSEVKNRVITSVKQRISDIQLSVYPNPSKGSFSVELKSNTNAPVVINVIDIKGKIVFAKQYTAQQGLIPIQLEKLAKGTYLVQAQQENDIVSRKVVVQ